MSEQQKFVQGSTLRLVVRVSDIGTDDPRNVDSVTLVGLTGSDPISSPFAPAEPGLYVLTLDSSELVGSYWWRAAVVEAGVGVSIVEDSFVVVAPH